MIRNIVVSLLILLTSIILSVKPKIHKTILITENVVGSEVTEDTQIDWAKWHSAVLNEIITNARTAPNNQPFETLNYIEFDVDNEKNVVNIKIYSEPQQYSTQAKKHFSKYVRQLDGRDVLIFPQGSQRKITHFKAVLKKSNKTELSTPDDFYDYENVKVK